MLPNGQLQNPMGYDWCDFENAFIPRGAQCSAGDDISELIEISCPKCNRKLCQYKVVPDQKIHDLKAIVDFRFVEENLLSYRPRPDGVLGLECICGELDTRLARVEKEQNPDNYPPYVPSTTTETAKVGVKKSKLSYNKIMLKDVKKRSPLHEKLFRKGGKS